MELARPLRMAGWEVEIKAEGGARAGRRVRSLQPHVVVIYLDCLPSHGRETARYLRPRPELEICQQSWSMAHRKHEENKNAAAGGSLHDVGTVGEFAKGAAQRLSCAQQMLHRQPGGSEFL